MPHHFHVTIERKDDPAPQERLQFDVTNHDDLFVVVARLKERDLLPEAEVAEFAIGLKLLGEVLLRHRKEPMFAELAGHFGDFMKKLKGRG